MSLFGATAFFNFYREHVKGHGDVADEIDERDNETEKTEEKK